MHKSYALLIEGMLLLADAAILAVLPLEAMPPQALALALCLMGALLLLAGRIVHKLIHAEP